jgi:uncharacterized protein (DUF2062 family)
VAKWSVNLGIWAHAAMGAWGANAPYPPMPSTWHTGSVAFEATLSTLYRWADKVLRLDDTPPRLAAAYAWGIITGFSPFFVIQYVVAFAVAILFRLNKLLVLAGLCTNLPWIMVPWYTATTAIAGAVLGVPLPGDLRGEFGALFSQSLVSWGFWHQLFGLVRPWLLPFLLGPTLGAVLLGLAVYPAALLVMLARQRQRSDAGQQVERA